MFAHSLLLMTFMTRTLEFEIPRKCRNDHVLVCDRGRIMESLRIALENMT